jgi:flagellar basal-body rod protein FlgB
MLNPLLGDGRVETLQKALGGLARRQQALSSNIANVDTPGYKRQDVNFESDLRASMGGGTTRLAATDARHMPLSTGGGSLFGAATADQGRTRSGRNDGNDVDVDYEMTKLAETSLRYQLLTQATSSRFGTLRELVSRVT